MQIGMGMILYLTLFASVCHPLQSDHSSEKTILHMASVVVALSVIPVLADERSLGTFL